MRKLAYPHHPQTARNPTIITHSYPTQDTPTHTYSSVDYFNISREFLRYNALQSDLYFTFAHDTAILHLITDCLAPEVALRYFEFIPPKEKYKLDPMNLPQTLDDSLRSDPSVKVPSKTIKKTQNPYKYKHPPRSLGIHSLEEHELPDENPIPSEWAGMNNEAKEEMLVFVC